MRRGDYIEFLTRKTRVSNIHDSGSAGTAHTIFQRVLRVRLSSPSLCTSSTAHTTFEKHQLTFTTSRIGQWVRIKKRYNGIEVLLYQAGVSQKGRWVIYINRRNIFSSQFRYHEKYDAIVFKHREGCKKEATKLPNPFSPFSGIRRTNNINCASMRLKECYYTARKLHI